MIEQIADAIRKLDEEPKATQVVYEIIGTYRGEREVLDEHEDKNEAARLVNEYRMAFGAGWHIWKRRVRKAA